MSRNTTLLSYTELPMSRPITRREQWRQQPHFHSARESQWVRYRPAVGDGVAGTPIGAAEPWSTMEIRILATARGMAPIIPTAWTVDIIPMAMAMIIILTPIATTSIGT